MKNFENKHLTIAISMLIFLIFILYSTCGIIFAQTSEGEKHNNVWIAQEDNNHLALTRSNRITKSVNTFSTGSTKFTVLSEPIEKTIYLAIPPGVNITQAKMSITGKTRETINKYFVGSRPSFISGADFDKDDNIDLIITDLDKSEFYILFGTGDMHFQSQSIYPTGDLPLKGTIDDFNNDGHPDFATANEGANTITVYRYQEKIDDPFAKIKDYKIGDMPRAITSGDFNNDSWIDIATITSNDNKLWLNLNKKASDGSFQDAINYTTDRSPTSITSGDVNNDKIDDIIITHVGANLTIGGKKYTDSVSILINKGNGEFLPRKDYLVGKKPAAVALDDFNFDGWLDIAVSNKVSNDISVLINKGEGKFKNSINYSLVQRATAGLTLRTGDIDGDGDRDIVSTCSANNTIEVLRNTGSGTFFPFEEYVGGHSPADISLADFNNDGDLDVVTANLNDGSISIVPNNGDGVYTTSEFYHVGGWPRGINHGDVDNDGDLDIVTANYLGGSLSIMYNKGNGYFSNRYDRHIAVEPFAVIIEDFDKDGYLDLASADEGLFKLIVIFNDGDGNYIKREKISYDLGGYPYQILYHDFNDDGLEDLITSNNLQQSISILWNIGNETGDDFAPFMNYSFPDRHPFGLAYGDMDGDGDDDLLCTNFGFESDPESSISIIWNNGNGSFGKPTHYGVGINPINLKVADFDLDGDLDIAAANRDSNSVTILENKNNSSYIRKSDHQVGAKPMGIEVVDFNKDGFLDIIIGNHENDSISIIYNNGDWTFQEHLEFPSGPQPTYLSIADFNYDGNLDIAASNKLSSTITMHLDFHKPSDVVLRIGDSNKSYYEHKGELTGEVGLPDFSERLNEYLKTHKADQVQTAMGPAILVPISVSSEKTGIIEFSGVDIEMYSPFDFDFDGITDSEDTDDDNDGMSDDWEQQYAFDPKDPGDSVLDGDNDNLTNLEEYLNNTDPADFDTDDDKLDDGIEVKVYKTSPLKEDTDGDDYSDYKEISEKTNPLDKDDHPEEEGSEICMTSMFTMAVVIFALIGIIIMIVTGVLAAKKK
jgi:hypothetical protein